MVARLGGDEFAVLRSGRRAETSRVASARRSSHVLEPPFRLDEFNLEVEASIGIAIFPDHGHDPADV